MSRETGRVKWFSSEKGYGFIEREGREDVFVHYSEISMDGFRTLDAGEPVEFDIITGDRGPKAQGVLRMSAAPAKAASREGRGGARSNGAAKGSRATPGLVGQLLGLLTNRA